MEMVIQQIDDDELRKRLQSAATGEPGIAHDFFAQFDYNLYLQNNQFIDAYQRIISILYKLQTLDQEAYRRIHKGVPFYFSGISAFILGNYENAVFFFDAAVSEDRKNDPGSLTPAIMFIQMNADPPNQAARELVMDASKKLSELLLSYSDITGVDKIPIEIIRDKLLTPSIYQKPEWRTLSTTFISFLLEWKSLAILREIQIDDGTREPFFIHLFKGCVLFESLLKANPIIKKIPQSTLGQILQENKEIREHLGITVQFTTTNQNLEKVLSTLPDRTDIYSDLLITAQLRNVIGHNINWITPLSSDQYIQLVNVISNSIIHVLVKLY